MHLSGLIIRTGQEKENSQTSKNIHKKKIDVIYQFSLKKHSAKAVSNGFFCVIAGQKSVFWQQASEFAISQQ